MIESLENRLLFATITATPGGESLQSIANRVNAGDTVIVKPGNYAGFQQSRDGTAAARITWSAEPGAIINRAIPRGDGINLEDADFVTIEGFKTVGAPENGIRIVEADGVIIRNNLTDASGKRGIFTGHTPNILIEHNTATNSKLEHGIYVSGGRSDGAVVRFNTCTGNNSAGVQLNADRFQGNSDGIISGAVIEGNILLRNGVGERSATINCDGLRDSQIVNNVIADSTNRNGIAVFALDGLQSRNNVIANNSVVVSQGAALHLRKAKGNTIFNNVLIGTAGARSYDIPVKLRPYQTADYNVVTAKLPGQDAHSVFGTTSNVFANYPSDLHLSSTSVALNRGVASLAGKSAPLVDFEGDARSGVLDIGADERA